MAPTIGGIARPAVGCLVLAQLLAACGGSGPIGTPSSPASGGAAATASATLAGTAPAHPGGSSVPGGLSISGLLGGTGAAPAATTWIRVSDPGAPFTFEVPSTWTMHSGYPWQQGGATIGVALAAGPDLGKLTTDFSVPGVVIGLAGNAAGVTARQVVEGDDFGSMCTASPIEEASEAAGTAAYRRWTSCGGGPGSLAVLAIAPAGGPGIIGIVFQATTETDLAYLDHIVDSIGGSSGGTPTAAPPTGVVTVPGSTYAISMGLCQNQHGQGVAEGLVRNEDTLTHTYRIVVAFFDPNGVFLNDTAVNKGDLPPGVTATWQAMVPSGLPAVTVSCRITAVEVVR